MNTEYIPSTTPGKTWAVGYFKPEGRPGYYSAQEGERGDGFFKCRLSFAGGGDRRLTQPVQTPATAKRREAARATLLATMRAEGLTQWGQP